MIRIGHSTDTHRLEPGYRLLIGGVRIPHVKGSVGHSDGDCLLHTVCESLIGALSLGDLGSLFPDTSEEFRGINSSLLVRKVMEKIIERGYHVVNIDSTVYLERPKLQQYIPQIRENIASLLHIEPEFVSVKATTGERVGIIGREEAIMTESVVLVSND
ncbi:2-C-methyl-D-erythritol 2,4-cyclodiphosphate synthase [Candidatus Xianfuyuplasma coldseepsis]|uniref:2-C-methyl-D-erythritol 2,4-cyclodiphosphate synthase n=1 Tax=Candidatus Xianfuyuplasma coldseepsis TaxID=2782163 RepID=A0A7L7KQE5_9MOLU|nr:2-C-methyl-D-erythritol 2,4-cyclodiphosphate synthase [Xianfuyuplasma coldseepsis]QMS84907.1 2-C-methyl-D-erythritol 2,4-cyclodiphosphate synthase [Xianfuyuplasma coldseepsis]